MDEMGGGSGGRGLCVYISYGNEIRAELMYIEFAAIAH